MEIVKSGEIKEFANPGVVSRQLLSPQNSRSERVTITEVHLEAGASQPRHVHDSSEQIWCALKGTGKLLLSDGGEREFVCGDVARFADGDVHGLLNDGGDEFVYISVTSPPIDFAYAYQENGIPFSMNVNDISSNRGLEAMKTASKIAEEYGISDMTLDEINAEIAEAR